MFLQKNAGFNYQASKAYPLNCWHFTSELHTVKASNFVILFNENIFFADLSFGYPKNFSGIEICTENA